ncbi:iron ABC transporter permease [Phascolarctobacterium succinatutens]|uniref:FecCD family ABC transporter permease n=1 Tax=Phascolarctobacterium succinatutens TaxID=626940 RepID=UPI0026EFA0BA|nr:iron ABC transporter permease [Phascolarctobacterium succinatutens]
MSNGAKTKEKMRIAVFFGLCILLVVGIFVSIGSGTVSLSVSETWAALMGEADADTDRIVNLIRLPRTIVTVLVGANLALAGCNLQGVLHNPLADPGIIGVSAGAGLFAMIIMLLFPEQSAMVPVAAFVGAVISTGIVFFLAWEKGINPLRMILAGVAIATFFGGGMSALNVFYSDRIQGTVMWMAGGFQGRSWGHVEMLLPYSAIGIIGTILCARSLNALQLGDELAKSLGVRVMRMRTILIFLSALLAAVSVSVAGMLGFVGLIVPHIMRLLIGSDHEYLLPCAAIAGGAVVTLADTAARTLFSPLEIPVGIFMSFIGGPFFLYLLKRRLR